MLGGADAAVDEAEDLEARERERGGRAGDRVEPAADGDADRGRGPDARRGGEPHDEALLQDDHAGADEADAGDDLRGDAGDVDAHGAVRARRQRGEDGPEVEPVLRDEHEEARAERDEEVRAQAGLLGAIFALESDEPAEQGGEREAKE